MRAPNLAVLFNIPPAVEKALLARFSAQLIALPVFIQRDTRELPSQYLGIQFTLGAALQHLHPLPDGTFRRDAWNYTLQLQLHTVRIRGRADVHGFLTGRIREIVTAARYDPAFLRYHVLSTMQEASQNESVQRGDDVDESDLIFTGFISIRPDAWPA